MKNTICQLLSILLLFLSSCGEGNKSSFAFLEGDTLSLNYAENLSLVENENYTVAILRNPWDTTRVLHTYILLPQESTLPVKELPAGTVVRTPLQRSVVYSSVHCSLIDELGAFASIAGVCDLKYIRLPKIHSACQTGTIHDLGNGMSPDIEKMIDLHPDAVLLSPFENSGGYGRIDKLGVPIIECADYMETSALGRAEWMRFYGRLFGCAERADSLFSEVEHSYKEWAGKVVERKDKPTVLCDLPIGTSAWYVPGGNSTIGRLYADAGAAYVFADDVHNGSVPFSFESVFEHAQEAQIWLIRYNESQDKTYTSLRAEYSPYTKFSAFRNRRIYSCNTGNSSFYEEVPFHPNRLLREFIQIFYPEMAIAGDSLRYYTPLKE